MRQTYTQAQKAEAMAAFLLGDSITLVATRMNLPYSTVANWKATTAQVATVIGHEKDELGELVTEYVRESLRTLRIQVREFSRPEWLEKQRAGEVAILHGVIADKTIRVLSAIHTLE